MKRLAFLLFILAAVPGVSAQTILLKNGQTVPADGLVRNGDMIMVSVKSSTGTTGQIGYHVSDVAGLNFPAPAILAVASGQVARGEFDQALAQIDPFIAYQTTIRDIPGNWWAKAALVKVSALVGLNREADARALVTEIDNYSKDPEILAAAKMQLVLATKFTDPKQALAAYDAFINQSTAPQTLSRAWIAEGDIHLSEREFADALMAYLTVTIFYPDNNPLVPKALWGAGQAYAKLKDERNATKTFQELVSNYPNTPEASLAKAELQKKKGNKT